MIGSVLMIGLIALTVLGMPVAFAIGVAVMGALMVGDYNMVVLPQKVFTGIDSFPMLSIPFFVLAGNLMTDGGITDRILSFSRATVGWMRGSLGFITVVASAIFSAISGSGTASVTAIGGITIPAMKEDGYPPELAAAITGSSATLGPLIPPSIILIVYGNSVQASIRDLFIGATIPGLLLTVGFMVYIYVIARRLNLPVGKRISVRAALQETWKSFWALLMPVIILGGIFGGIFTATEAAAVSAVYAFIIGAFVYKNLTFESFRASLYDSCITSSIMLFLVGCSKASSWVLAAARIPEALAAGMLSFSSEPVVLLLLLNIFLLIVGMFMEANVAVLIFTPILLPIALAAGLSVIEFGVVMCFNLCLGLITPPVGLCALLANNMAGAKLEKTLVSSGGFFLVGVFFLLLATYMPYSQITWLIEVLK